MAALSDGVFAIAITLLVLPLTDADLQGGPLQEKLLDLRSPFFAFVLSFVVIGRYWLAHHDDVREMMGVDNRVLVANLVFLFFIVLLPFPTALLGEVGGLLPTLIYAVTIIATALSSLALSRTAGRAGLTRDEDRSRAKTNGSMAAALGFVPSLGLVFLSPAWAQVSWFLVLPLSTLADRLEARRHARP